MTHLWFQLWQQMASGWPLLACHERAMNAHFSVAMHLPFKACPDLTLSGPLKASHFSAIYGSS